MDAVRNSLEDPFQSWKDLAKHEHLPEKSGKQIRERWVNNLNPALVHLPFRREDVSKVYSLFLINIAWL